MTFADDFPESDERYYPNLVSHGYVGRSPATDRYNCFAWAARDNKHWWQPGRFWPPGVPATLTVETLVMAYRTRGFEPCEDGRLERGFEKIAIYADDKGPTHAA